MVNDGIYEQIVNEKLQNELNQLDMSQYDIELDKIDANDARKILTIYILGRRTCFLCGESWGIESIYDADNDEDLGYGLLS